MLKKIGLDSSWKCKGIENIRLSNQINFALWLISFSVVMLHTYKKLYTYLASFLMSQ